MSKSQNRMKWNSFRKGLNGGFHMLQSNALTDLYYVPQLLTYYRQILERLVEQICNYPINSSQIILQQNIALPKTNLQHNRLFFERYP